MFPEVVVYLIATGACYGTTLVDPNWNPIADVAEPYGEIDIVDIATVALDYGKTV